MADTDLRWEKLEALFDEAIERPPEQRDAWLAEACPDDTELRQEVAAMAAAHDRPGGLLEQEVDLAGPLEAARNEPPTEDMPAVLTPVDLASGEPTVGRYRLERQIGRGGMGIVYQARDTRLGRDVALKFLSRRHAAPDAVERFLAEARAASALDHPNICIVHDAGETDDGRFFIAMAFYQGETLAERIYRGPLAVNEAVELARQAASGLDRAHRAGIVHRDVKPANLMITDRHGPDRLKILDFGIAKLEDSRLTQPGMVPGTPAYMAPEQLAGEPIDGRTDLWALGIVLYEMLTGELPYDGSMRAILATEVRSLTAEAARRGIPEPLAHLVDRLLSKDRSERPASAGKLAEELEDVQLRLTSPNASLPILRTLVVVKTSRSAERSPEAQTQLDEHGGRDITPREASAPPEENLNYLVFDRPWSAVRWALQGMQATQAGPTTDSIALHLAEVFHRAGGEPKVDRAAVQLAAQLVNLAGDRQILLTRGAFDLARQAADGRPRWLAHGAFRFREIDEPVEVFEVGEKGGAPLASPAGGPGARPVAAGDAILGWRPAAGEPIAQRPGWRLVDRLGEGGFGEVWLAANERSGEHRAFKFCLEARRLRALKREIALFRLLKVELGERDDIARILGWNFDTEPYFIESEVSEAGDLTRWADRQGGLGEVPLDLRLALVSQVAEALAAAHSVGVLHKDVKPSNILIRNDLGGDGPRAQLADFGVGLLTEPTRLEHAGIALTVTRSEITGTGEGTTGTPLYRAPELLEGKPATLQADVYALGVMLYQMVVGDFYRALGPGWERDVEDELLREDIARAVDKSPRRRLGNAARLAENLGALAERRRRREAERRERRAAQRARQELERSQRRRKLASVALLALTIFAGILGWQLRRADREAARANREAETVRQVVDFLVRVFEISDPASGRGRDVTARQILELGAARLDAELQDQPEVRSRLMRTLGTVYRSLGLYPEAAPLLEDALASQRQLWGEEHPEVARTLDELADLERLQGRYDRAGALAQAALDLRRHLLGDEHLDLATSLGTLAQIHVGRGDYAMAEPLYLEALEMRRQLLGREHPRVARSLHNLAAMYAKKGDHYAAERLYTEALDMHRRLSGGEHPETAMTLSNLAAIHYRKGDYVAAESFAREASELYRRLLGDQHPDLARSLNILGQVLQEQGDLDAAEPLYREALVMRRHLLTEDHPSLANSLTSLAWLLKVKGDFETAEEHYLEALGIRRRFYGDEHSLVANSLSHLGWLKRSQGDLATAERYFRDVLAMHRRLSGDQHPEVARGMDRLADLLIEAERLDEAHQLLLDALEILRPTLPPDHWQLAATRGKLGAALAGLGRDAEAEPLLLASYQALRLERGEQARITRSIRHHLATFYDTRGAAAQAAVYRDPPGSGSP